MPYESPFVSCFSRVFDVAVFGAGYPGLGATLAAAGKGKSVLLVDLRGDAAWESGRAFQTDTGAWDGEFRIFAERVALATGLIGEVLDSAVAEVVANEQLRLRKADVLYYAAPVAVEREGDRLAAVIVATKSGLRRVIARQWIDATETGSLARLLAPALRPRRPARLSASIFLQQVRWPTMREAALDVPELPGCRVTWRPSPWSVERIIRVDMPGGEERFLRAIVPALKAAREQLAGEFGDAFVSHCSIEPYPVYDAGADAAAPAANVVVASPALIARPIATLAERYGLGIGAFNELSGRASADAGEALLRKPVPAPENVAEESAEIVVAGLGVSGALAALAAAREGADVLAVEPLAFPGGIGTGGGISSYYWGFSGGLQDEVNARDLQIMPLFSKKDIWGGRFHPDVRRVVLDDMLRAAGVRATYGAMLVAAERRQGRVESALIATLDGPRRVRAKAWIDATGDGDLAAAAGAAFRMGRAQDGNLHAYTQSCGRFRLKDGRLLAGIVNFDSGFVDPADSEDMTRARMEGIHQHHAYAYNAIRRPCIMSPLLGLRQGRLVETDYLLSVDDLFERRRFPDAIGFTGMHYDNHAVDYEFESDISQFLVWACGLRSAVTACEMPYRILLPKGLDNLWLACRALGVTEEAHHSLRSQRDMQRTGEAAGLAAALAARTGCGSRQAPYAELRARLEKSGALTARAGGDPVFGPELFAAALVPPDAALSPEAQTQKCLEALRGAEWGPALWRLYRHGKPAAERIRALLNGGDEALAWRAALLLAGWGDPAAEPRLVRAVAEREIGVDCVPDKDFNNKVRGTMPRWWVAAALLKICGTARCLPALAGLAREPELQLNMRNIVALACERIAQRGALSGAERRQVEELLRPLTASRPPHAVAIPTRDPLTGEDTRFRKPWLVALPLVEEDFTWQVHYAVARARRALGLPPQDEALRFRSDPRAIVRRAFEKVFAQ